MSSLCVESFRQTNKQLLDKHVSEFVSVFSIHLWVSELLHVKKVDTES